MASAETAFDSTKDAWFDIDFYNTGKTGTVKLEKRDFQRLGDVSAWLTSEAFDLKDARSIEAESAMQAAMDLAKSTTATKSEIDKVDKQLKASLSDTDLFWMRWVACKASLKR